MKKIILLFSLMLNIALTFSQTGCISGDCKNGQGTYISDSGGKYTGNWVNGERNGQGTFVWRDGDVYTGNWVNGEKNGQGTFVWKDGDVYKGNFENSNYEGQGTMTYKNNKKFEGIWKGGKVLSGTGYFEYSEGSYEGKFVNGKQVGKGVFTFSDGTKVNSTWVNGESDEYNKALSLYKKNKIEKALASDLVVAKNRKAGKCTSGDCVNGTGISEIEDSGYSYSFGDHKPITSYSYFDSRYLKSEGQWKNGRLYNGTGYLYDASIINGELKNSLYYGEVKDGKRFGKGIYVDFDGNYFEGTLDEKNQYNTKSDPYYKNHSYTGGMMNKCFSGQGLLVFNEKYSKKKYYTHFLNFPPLEYGIEYTGKQYEGIFEKSRLVKGTILYDDGSKEEVEKIDSNNDKVIRWDKKGAQVFEGIRYIYKSGSTEESVAFFTCQGDCANGIGKKTDNYGNTYEGNWKNGVYEGKGKLTYAKQGFVDHYYDGNWKNGLFEGLGEWKGKDELGFQSSYSGNWSQGKKNGHGVYSKTYYSNEWIKVETDFTNDQMGNKGSTTKVETYYTPDYVHQGSQNRTANWRIENEKVIATIIQNDFKNSANPNFHYEFYKYEGEIEDVFSVKRMGMGTTYKTINDANPITENYVWDMNDKDYAISKSTSEEIDTRCNKCSGFGYIWEKYTVGGGTYTTGGETMRSQSTSTSGIVERSNGSKYIETTTTYGTYKNPTYTFNVAGHEKDRKVTCPVCNGTGKKK
jgi:hypothetical protein